MEVRERSAELAVGWIEAWIAMDLEWLRRHLAPDFVHTSPFGRLEGRDSYLATVEPMARKSVLELTIVDVVAAGDQAAIHFENRTPGGVVDSCDWVRIAGDRIQEIRSFYDSAKIREVLSPAEQGNLGRGVDEGAASSDRVSIEPYEDSRLEAIVELSLRAWEPVFASIESVMDPDVYREQHPDWRVSQRSAVESVCADDDCHVWVATEGAATVGFVALKLHTEDRMGEIYMVAVDPDAQGRGIASALTEHSLAWLGQAGMTTVMVETGGDPGHAPARRVYESAGFRLFPVARYFKKL